MHGPSSWRTCSSMASSSPRDIRLLLHRSRDVLPQPTRFGTDWEEEFWMGCREPGCNVLHRLGRWGKYGEAAIGVASFSADSEFCRRGPVGSECVDREFTSDHSRALSQGTLFISACKSNAQHWQTNPCLLAHNGKSTPFFQCALRTKLILPFLSFLTLTTFRIGLGARSYTTSRGPYLSGSYSTSSAGG